MHPCAMLLGEVLAISKLEEEALMVEDYDQVEDLAEKRSQLLEQAWKEREGYDTDLLRNTLLVIEAMHQRLQEIGAEMRETLAEALRNTKKQDKYLASGRYEKASEQRALYFDKVS